MSYWQKENNLSCCCCSVCIFSMVLLLLLFVLVNPINLSKEYIYCIIASVQATHENKKKTPLGCYELRANIGRFFKSIFSRTGSAISVEKWLKNHGKNYFPAPVSLKGKMILTLGWKSQLIFCTSFLHPNKNTKHDFIMFYFSKRGLKLTLFKSTLSQMTDFVKRSSTLTISPITESW